MIPASAELHTVSQGTGTLYRNLGLGRWSPKQAGVLQNFAAYRWVMKEAAIRVNGLTKIYGKTVAVDDIAFAVETGSITALLGGNGAGKTTTIAMLLGLLLPTSGNIEVLGENMIRSRYRPVADEFWIPLCRPAEAADCPGKLAGICHPVRYDRCRGPY